MPVGGCFEYQPAKEGDVNALLRNLIRTVAVAAVAVGLLAGAAAAQQSNRVPVDQKTTQQKAIFVKNLVTKSVSAKTLEESGDADAIAKLKAARDLVEQAHAELASGAYEDANDKLDQAIRLVNAETRRLSQTKVSAERMEEGYDRRHHSVETFLKAYRRVAGEKQVSPASLAQMKEIEGLVTEAEALAAKKDYAKANAVLDDAYRIARSDIKGMRQGKTLTRSLDFETPADEYRYEHDRNDSHVMLLRFALTEKNPPKSVVKRIDQLKTQASQLRSDAEAEAKAGDHETAIDTISRSTETLLKAIRMSGIFIPG
jgi:tetratricopeptide (TPR) repeat protein